MWYGSDGMHCLMVSAEARSHIFPGVIVGRSRTADDIHPDDRLDLRSLNRLYRDVLLSHLYFRLRQWLMRSEWQTIRYRITQHERTRHDDQFFSRGFDGDSSARQRKALDQTFPCMRIFVCSLGSASTQNLVQSGLPGKGD